MENQTIAVETGSCLDLLPLRNDASVDLVFADPPFNIKFDYDQYDDNLSTNDYLDWSEAWIQQVYRILKPNGTFWLAIGDEYAADLKVIAQRQIGFHCRSWVIWYYTFGTNCTRKFTRSHVHLFHFTKHRNDFTFNGHDITIPSARQLIYNDNRANPRGRLPDDTWVLRPSDAELAFAPCDDVWSFPRICGTFKERVKWHNCQMPERLLERIIRVSSNQNDLVLDPFLGSGTTLVVAKQLNRNGWGCDISSDYTTKALERINNA